MSVLVNRFISYPLITPEMLPGNDGSNINGPSLIKVPDWVQGRLGLFYLYFAHHHGQYIRLAYADSLSGPWKIYTPGVLSIENVNYGYDHLASPDVHIDHASHQIKMYFHSVVKETQYQKTYIATSSDGIHFISNSQPIAEFYFRTIQWKNAWIGMSKGGIMYYSKEGNTRFEALPQSVFPMSDRWANASGDVRHVALDIKGDILLVYYTRIADKPESIYRARINLNQSPSLWYATHHELILSPEEAWEGVNLPVFASKSGAALSREHALRDPAIFLYVEKTFLLYAGGGESAIGIVELIMDSKLSEMNNVSMPRLLELSLPNPKGLDKEILYGNELTRLSYSGNLEARLIEIDKSKPINRIYVMGCGRSGTWLLTATLATFNDLFVLSKEVPVEQFGVLTTTGSTLVLKRLFNSYMTIELIPPQIKMIYIIRHPFDVLTSYNPNTNLKYHIDPDRWMGEMRALKYLIDFKRSHVLIIKYEDLVTDPDLIQLKISTFFNLEIKTSMDNISSVFNASAEAISAMLGQRKIDKNSMNKFRSNPNKIEYLKSIKPKLGLVLDWVAEAFDYDVDLLE